jgi:cyclophilin family peptidyl-prolyl cis-trans isomerase
MRHVLALTAAALAIFTATAQSQTKPAATADPVFVLETAKGTIEIRLFAKEAPKSVEHMVALIKRSFYRGQRFHRVTPVLAQTGDPQSRNMSQEAYWGNGNSGSPIGVFERVKTRLHVRGAVGLAHSGNPLGADSQFYIMKQASPRLDGKHAVVGQVVVGMDVVDQLKVPDLIKNASLK